MDSGDFMWRFGLRRAGRFALGLLGAILMAAVVAAQAAPPGKGGVSHFIGTVLSRLGEFVRFDFGSSAITAASAAQEVAQRLPATLELVAAGAAGVQLALRRAVNEARDAPYRRGLKMMGLSQFEVDRLYLVPQVFAGVLANLGEIALSLFSAAAVAEWVFGWPGAAVLFLKSVALHDWSVVALVLLSFAAITLIAEFLGSLGARALAGIEANP